MSSARLIPLEATRGIAALIVIVHHFFLGFAPQVTGLLPELRTPSSIIGNWYYVFFSGDAAVNFFFVLSGFVLCWGYFHSQDHASLKRSVIKRWPRLAGPVLVTTLVSYCLFKLGAYHFPEAALLTKSPWLGTFALAGWTPEFTPNIFKAIIQGLTTFFSGDATYNSNLWTMRPEFLGSLVVFLLGALMVGIFSLQYAIVLAPLFLVWALGTNVFFFPFVLGLFLAAWMASQSNKRKIGLATALFFIIGGLYLLGYEIAAKDYAWTVVIKHPFLLVSNIKVVFHSVGAALIIFAVMQSPKIFQLLNGRVGFYLGKLSFPLYLVHTLVICSVSSYWFIRWEQSQSANFPILVATFVLTVMISILAAIPMIFLDGIWLKFINCWALSFFRRK